jgi:hypothetical protein
MPATDGHSAAGPNIGGAPLRKRIVICGALAAVCLVSCAGATVASAASTQTPGAIKMWVSPSPTTTTKHPGHVLITGVIGDYGPSVSATSTGKPVKKKSVYTLLKLKHGTILVNTKALNSAGSNATPTINSTNCSISIAATAPVQIVKGTGAYAGINGTVTFSVNIAAVLPKTKSGSCTHKTATKPLDTYGSFVGSGTVSYGVAAL